MLMASPESCRTDGRHIGVPAIFGMEGGWRGGIRFHLAMAASAKAMVWESSGHPPSKVPQQRKAKRCADLARPLLSPRPWNP